MRTFVAADPAAGIFVLYMLVYFSLVPRARPGNIDYHENIFNPEARLCFAKLEWIRHLCFADTIAPNPFFCAQTAKPEPNNKSAFKISVDIN